MFGHPKPRVALRFTLGYFLSPFQGFGENPGAPGLNIFCCHPALNMEHIKGQRSKCKMFRDTGA